MDKIILHCDINHCYAQIEEMKYPELKKVAMAVGGYETTRHGIILAKNDLAKPYGIRTGESLREAYEKCPNLLVIPPHYEEYLYYTERIKDIYRDYSDQVESFGLDEAWVDITKSLSLFDGDVLHFVKKMQRRILDEVGINVSIGISFNKIFAKLGSDMNKKAGITYISKENYQSLVWPQPVDHLLYVGRATKQKLYRYGILTIGDLACYDVNKLKQYLGKMGEIIWMFANGKDEASVASILDEDNIKSIGNGITTPKDIINIKEAKLVFYVLAESVASRLRDANYKASTISIHLRDTNLTSFTRQCKIETPTDVCDEIMKHVMKLLKEHYDFHIPLRSVTLSVSQLSDALIPDQLSLFEEENKQDQRVLDQTIDQIRNRYGFSSIKRCSMLLDEILTDFNPKQEHIIHPIGYFHS